MASGKRRSARVPSGRLSEIAELAEEVANRHCPRGAVDPHVILKAKEITWSCGRYDDAFDGMLEHDSGRFHVYCNLNRVEREDSPRARFTLGHELGHFYIDEHRCELRAGRTPGHGSICEYESKNPAEQEADHFASNLLMPASRFISAAKGSPPGLGGVLCLTSTFGTSITSTAIRYATLNIKPCVVVKWADGKFQWQWLSDETRMARYWTTIKSTDKLPDDCPTARALAGEKSATKYFQAGTTAAAWFPYVPHGSFRNVIMIEQAVALGRFGVLTFLYPEAGEFPQVDV